MLLSAYFDTPNTGSVQHFAQLSAAAEAEQQGTAAAAGVDDVDLNTGLRSCTLQVITQAAKAGKLARSRT